jgi:ABC-type amino acid transport substrate-binding protein
VTPPHSDDGHLQRKSKANRQHDSARVEIEFIPWTHESVFNDLNRGKFDIAIGGLIVSPDRLAVANFSDPYLDLTTAVVVEDHARKNLKIGA